MLTYHECHQKFCELAKTAGADLRLSPTLGEGLQGEELTQAYAGFWSKNAKGLVLHLSGVHGAEGFIGSLAQQNLLKNRDWIQKYQDAGWSVLLVHAMNPFGMSWIRRVNAENVDLNRNGIDHRNPPQQYKLLHEKVFKEIERGTAFWFLKTLLQTRSLSFNERAQVIAGGQYQNRKQIFFGGSDLQKELIELRSVLKERSPQELQRIQVLDIHTGLGEFGKESFFRNGVGQSPALWPEVTSLSVPYRAHGEVAEFLEREFPHSHLNYWTQEFGTLSASRVLWRLLEENKSWQKGELRSARRIRHLREAFFPSSSVWQRMVLDQCWIRWQNMLDVLNNEGVKS